MVRVRFSQVALPLLLLAGVSCASPATPTARAGADQEIARAINWELRKDARFADVVAYCVDGTVRLQGRVADAAAAQDALRLARARARGGQVLLQLDVRPR